MTQPDAAVTNQFSIFQNVALTDDPIWEFQMSRTPKLDLPVNTSDAAVYGHVRGRTRWWDRGFGVADRRAYYDAYTHIQHTDRIDDDDTTHHDFLNALRFAFQEYGAIGNRIIDRKMNEDPFNQGRETQGLAPYPYEQGRILPISTSHPGGVIDVLHFRKRPAPAQGVKNQLLTRIIIPASDSRNPETHWWYQIHGDFVATNREFITARNPQGIVAHLQVSAVHPAYSFEIEGVTTK